MMTWKQQWRALWTAMGDEMATWTSEERREFARMCRLLERDAMHISDQRRFRNYAEVAERVERGEPAVLT